MKKLCTFLLLASLPYSGFCSSADMVNETTELNFFTHHWTGNESLQNLYFNIDLNPDFDFPKNYTTTQCENGTGCEIICKPKSGTKFESEKGVLEQLKITVNLSNCKTANRVNYLVITELTYKKSGFFTNTITTTSSSSTGTLQAAPVNINEWPQFVAITGEPTQAVIIFKLNYCKTIDHLIE